MPRGLKVCAQPGCPELTTTHRCPTHTAHLRAGQAQHRRDIGDDAMKLYNTTAWRRRRARFIRRNPDCAACGKQASDVDHVAPRRILVAAGINDPDADMWLQPLCGPCHSRKTATVDALLLARLRAGEPAEALAALAIDGDLAPTQGCTP